LIKSHPGEGEQGRESGRIRRLDEERLRAAVERPDERKPPRFPLIFLPWLLPE